MGTEMQDQTKTGDMTRSKPKPKVLIIDDEAGLRDMLLYSLGNHGYEVTVAGNGLEAIQKARAKKFDLALCDIMMPGLSGIETLKALKEISSSLEVVMATGYATLETAVEAMKLGAYDYISKPYELDQLESILKRALEHSRLRARVGELEQINRLKSEFLANMSHELRTPLNAIVGYTSLILEKIYGDIPMSQEEPLKRVMQNSKNLLELINNILDFSKLNAGMMPTYLEEFDLGVTIREVVETMQCLAREKNIALTAEGPTSVKIRTDRTKIKQILINLVGNAIKFTAVGGVTVRLDAPQNQDNICIEVRDTGCGMDPNEVPLIFEEFKQLDGASTRKHGGTGLGLSITKKLVDLLKGSISVESNRGLGSTFTVKLQPVGAAKMDKPETLLPRAPLAGRTPKKILLAIDDDPEVLRLLRDSLSGTGYQFVGALTGEEGLALARQLKPAIVTLDILMPHRDGWSILQLFKNDPELRSIPVIILSIIENKSLGFSLGVADYIVKPFERQTLLKKLNCLEKLSRKNILLIDDDVEMTELIQATLKNEGYIIDTAATGQAAISKLKTNRPDAIFLDLGLPDMSGFDVLEEIKNDPSLQKVRIFVLTGQELNEKETDLLEKRVERIIKKGSISLAEILGALKEKLLALAEVN